MQPSVHAHHITSQPTYLAPFGTVGPSTRNAYILLLGRLLGLSRVGKSAYNSRMGVASGYLFPCAPVIGGFDKSLLDDRATSCRVYGADNSVRPRSKRSGRIRAIERAPHEAVPLCGVVHTGSGWLGHGMDAPGLVGSICIPSRARINWIICKRGSSGAVETYQESAHRGPQ